MSISVLFCTLFFVGFALLLTSMIRTGIVLAKTKKKSAVDVVFAILGLLFLMSALAIMLFS